MKAPAILCAVTISFLSGQTPPAFEAASIRESSADASNAKVTFSAGGFSVQYCTLSLIIQRAYGLRDFQLAGGPGWISDGTGAHFDIQAKADAETSDQQLKAMARTMLAERFQLKAHRETRILPVYALVQVKGGSKFQPTKPGEPRYIESYPGFVSGTNLDIALFIDEFSSKVDRPVVDKTDLPGHFDFTLRWTPDRSGSADPNLGSIFTAIQEQLGLKLEPQKLPFEVLVIDSVERPSAN